MVSSLRSVSGTRTGRDRRAASTTRCTAESGSLDRIGAGEGITTGSDGGGDGAADAIAEESDTSGARSIGSELTSSCRCTVGGAAATGGDHG